MTVHEVSELVVELTALVVAVGGLVAVLRGVKGNRDAIESVHSDVRDVKANGGTKCSG